MMPQNWRSSRTTLVKRSEWLLALSARAAKSETATRGLPGLPRPVPARNQSCAKELPGHRRIARITKNPNRLTRRFTSASCLQKQKLGLGEQPAEIIGDFASESPK